MQHRSIRGSKPTRAIFVIAIAVLLVLSLGIFEYSVFAQTITINSVTSHTTGPALVGGSGTTLTPCDAPTITVNFDFSGFTNESHAVNLQVGTTTQSVTAVSGASGTGVSRTFTSNICGEVEGLLDFSVSLDDSGLGTQTQTATSAVELDVTAPSAPSTPDLNAASDSGSSPTDDITNVTMPQFDGTAEADSTVTITSSVNGNVGSGTATGGNYSITTSALTGSIAGTVHSITATAQDAAGNVSAASAGLNVTIDTGVNAPATPDLAAGSDSGSSMSDNITNNTTPQFTGASCDTDSTITLNSSVDGDLNPMDQSCGGTYSITVTTTLSGSFAGTSHNIRADATDTAGNTASSGTLSITIDTGVNAPSTPDLAAGSDSFSAGNSNGTNSDDITNDTTPLFTGTAETDSNVTITSSVNSAVGSGFATGGNYSITTSTLTGSFAGTDHDITASAVDLAGNSSSASTALTVTIDTGINMPSMPDLDSSSDSFSAGNPSGTNSDDITNDTTPLFTGTAETDSNVTITSSVNSAVGSGFATGGNYSITTSTLTGSFAGTDHDITASAVDLAGNSSSASTALTVTIDTGINMPSTPDLDSSSDSFSAGNPTGTNSDDITNDTTPLFTGTAEADSNVTITSSVDSAVGTGFATSGNYSITTSTLTGSTLGTLHNMTASAVDIAGNSSASSSALAVTIDNFVDSPSVPDLNAGSDTGSSATDDITNDTTPQFDGTAEDDSVVTLSSSVNGTIGSGTATGGNYSITSSTLTGGTLTNHNITGTAIDVAGNSSDTSSPLAITIDTVAPAGFSESISGPTFTGGGIVYVASSSNPQLAATDISVDASDSSGAGTGIDSCQLQIDSGGFSNYGTISGGALNGDNFNLPAPDGPHSYDINCTDVAGNMSGNFSRTRTVDDTPPDISNPRHQNTTCHPAALCNAGQDIAANTFVKSLPQASITTAYPSVAASTFDYPSYSDPVAGVNPGSGVDACALSGTQADTGNYAAGVDFAIAIGDGAKTFSLSCDDNLGNNNTLDSPTLQVDDTPPVIPNNLSHDNTTCYPFSACISGSEIVASGTYVKAEDKQPFFPENPLLPDYPQFIPRSTFQWEQTDTGGTIDDPVSGGVMSGLRDCVLTGGTTQDNTIFSPPFTDIFSLQAIDGAYTVRDNCRDNLGNQAFTDGATINVDDTAPSADFVTSGPRYDDPVDGVIFIESQTQITPTMSDGGVGVDLGGIGGPPADSGPTNPPCEQNLDERTIFLQPCLSTFSFSPPDEDHHLWIMRPDLLGNVAESHFIFIVDDTYPVINLETPSEGATYLLNSIVEAKWDVNDEGLTFFNDEQDAPFAPGLDKRGSGIQSVTATTPSGQPIDTDDIAVHSFTIVVTDNLGHTTALTVSYRTILDFVLEEDFREQLEGEDPFTVGDMLELKFSLTDVNGIAYTGVTPIITLFGPDDEPIDIGDDRRADFDEELGVYIFPIDTTRLEPGRYTIVVEVGDGEFHEVTFDLIE